MGYIGTVRRASVPEHEEALPAITGTCPPLRPRGLSQPTGTQPWADWTQSGASTSSLRRHPVPGFGVDTLVLRTTVDPGVMGVLERGQTRRVVDTWTGVCSDEHISAWQCIPAGHESLNVRVDRFGVLRMEFSAPKVLRGHNVFPASQSEVMRAFTIVAEELRSRLGFLPPVETWSVARVDVARDVAVDDVAGWLDAVSQRPAARVGDTTLRLHGQRATSLTRQVTRWTHRAYDKPQQLIATGHAEWATLAQVRPLRLEWQCRDPGLLRQYGLGTVAELVQADLLPVAERYARRCRHLDDAASSTARPCLLGLSNTERRGVVAVLLCDQLGIPSGYGKNVEQGARALIRKRGLAGSDLRAAGLPGTLDFAAGRVVV